LSGLMVAGGASCGNGPMAASGTNFNVQPSAGTAKIV
jgi:hypothetical protein